MDSAFFFKCSESLSFFIQYTVSKFYLSAHKSLNISSVQFKKNGVTRSQAVAFIYIHLSYYLLYKVHFSFNGQGFSLQI